MDVSFPLMVKFMNVTNGGRETLSISSKRMGNTALVPILNS